MRPPKPRWKLWHLLATVAGAAVLMAMAAASPELFVGLVFLILGVVPPFWVARKLDDPEMQPTGSNRDRSGEAFQSCLGTIAFGIGFLVYCTLLLIALFLVVIGTGWFRSWS